MFRGFGSGFAGKGSGFGVAPLGFAVVSCTIVSYKANEKKWSCIF